MMLEDSVYTLLAVVGVMLTIAACLAAAVILSTVFATWLGLILGAIFS